MDNRIIGTELIPMNFGFGTPEAIWKSRLLPKMRRLVMSPLNVSGQIQTKVSFHKRSSKSVRGNPHARLEIGRSSRALLRRDLNGLDLFSLQQVGIPATHNQHNFSAATLCKPTLKHQYRPDEMTLVVSSLHKSIPSATSLLRIKKSFSRKTARIE